MRWRLQAAAVLAIVAIGACRDNPNIDGSKVAASSADCPSVCERLIALCGYAPSGENCSNADGGGYCETQLTGSLDCFASAPSCQAAWDCVNSVAPDDAGMDGDGSTDDGSTDDGSSDSGSNDDASSGDAADD